MERTVRVEPEAGLHARPASKLVQTANRFDADVSVGRAADGDDGLVRADSMLAVSGLNVEHGESVRVVAEGPDAEAALEALCEPFASPLDGGDGETEGSGNGDPDAGDAP